MRNNMQIIRNPRSGAHAGELKGIRVTIVCVQRKENLELLTSLPNWKRGARFLRLPTTCTGCLLFPQSTAQYPNPPLSLHTMGHSTAMGPNEELCDPSD